MSAHLDPATEPERDDDETVADGAPTSERALAPDRDELGYYVDLGGGD